MVGILYCVMGIGYWILDMGSWVLGIGHCVMSMLVLSGRLGILGGVHMVAGIEYRVVSGIHSVLGINWVLDIWLW